ncbi:MAG TPA: hypothetical protein VES39_07870, partial [Rhodospirillales bacterium]|nr:hypothetical protein [Rhodospirillales bacterium]
MRNYCVPCLAVVFAALTLNTAAAGSRPSLLKENDGPRPVDYGAGPGVARDAALQQQPAAGAAPGA